MIQIGFDLLGSAKFELQNGSVRALSDRPMEMIGPVLCVSFGDLIVNGKDRLKRMGGDIKSIDTCIIGLYMLVKEDLRSFVQGNGSFILFDGRSLILFAAIVGESRHRLWLNNKIVSDEKQGLELEPNCWVEVRADGIRYEQFHKGVIK